MDPPPPVSGVEAARAIGADLYRELRLEERLRPFAANRYRGELSCPTLNLDDFSGIPFLDNISGVAEYQHRARLRSGDGDLVATLSEPAPGSEEYFSEVLRLGDAGTVVAAPTRGPLAVAAACLAPPVLRRLVETAKRARALVIQPFMGIAEVWELAAAIGRESGAAVEVLAPPPPVTWIANDKASFEDLVRRVLGPEWLVPSRRSRRPEELATQLLELAEESRRVALKRLRCASAMGNLVLSSGEMRAAGARGVQRIVEDFLERTGWDGQEEVLAVVWEETDQSPSTQWWIGPKGAEPPRLDGPEPPRLDDPEPPRLDDPEPPRLDDPEPPRLDGIYDQILEGEEKVFIGSRPSRLPQSLQARLADAARRVATALQGLGYVGRCSFDHLVVGDPLVAPRLLFTECNGRWGGTSTPMHLVDRVVPGPRPLYRAQDFVSEKLVGAELRQFLAKVEGELYRVERGAGRFLFYNVGPLRKSGKIDVIALAETHQEADWALEELLPGLLGL